MAVLEKLTSIDSGFTYNFYVDKFNKFTGFVWMTLVTRSDLYCFGSYISVDFMERKANINLWPCIGPVVMNGLKKLVLYVHPSF